ncbi:MAG: RNA polymerase sigma-70 factor (ECF subfamily) [Chlamydiales bacterium]|jgi:RNA polymerase sigma-70 factor (ECF subfamily)
MVDPDAKPNDPETLRYLEAAKGGDAESFAHLYEAIAPALYTWAELRIRPTQRAHLDPQDLVQEVWFRAWRSIERFDAENVPFRLWIFRVAKNVLLEGLRRMQRLDQAGGVGPTTRMFALQNMPDEATAVSRRMAREETLADFAVEIRGLPQEDQKLVVHCGLEGLAYKDVAGRLGISADAVAKRWQRLRARLAEQGVADRLLTG